MAEEPQTPPSLEEFRAAQAAQAKKASPPSLEEFRAAQAAQNGQQPPFVQAPSQQQPPQGGSVGAPAGASRSTSAAGGVGAIAAPPAPAMSFSDIDRARAAQLPEQGRQLPPGGAQLAREGIIRKEGQVVSPEEKIAAAPTPTLYPDLNAVRVAKADLLEKVRQQGFADETDMKRNAFYLEEERKLLDGNLKTWQQKLAEHNQNMADERYRKSRGMGDAIYESVVLPVSGTAQRMALNTVGSTARMLEAVGQLPAAVTGDDPYRSALGELADMASSSVEQAETMESTKTKGALFNEDWEVNKDAFLPQLMRTATYMAGMMGGGLAAGKSGVVAASMLTTEEDYYRDAKEKGLSDQQAQAFAIAGAGMTSALELISPQLYGQGTAKKMLAEKAIQFIKGGATQKQALADAAKFVAEEVGKENVQELSQMLGDKVVEGAANMALGEDRFDTAVSMQEVAETVVMTSILSGLAAGGARAIDRPIRLQSMEWAARNPDAVRKYINEAVPEQQRDNLLERLDVLEKAYNGLPASIQQDEDLERKAEILDAVAEKQEIKAQQKKAVVDETVAALEGDKYEEALNRADARIATALGATMEKVRAAQERKKMAEKEGKAPQATKAIPDTPAQTMEWEGAAVQPRQEEQPQVVDEAKQEPVQQTAEQQAVLQPDERAVVAEPPTPAAPATEEGVAPIADIAPEAIAEIDDVLGVAPVAPAAQPEGPVRPEGTGAIPVSERRAKTQPGGRRPMVYVENVQKALSNVAPGMKVFVHATPDAYRAAIEDYNAKHGTKADPSQSTAIYLPASEEVHLSPSADGQGLAHEAAHPIVSALIAHKPEVFERLYDELAADPAMAKMLEFGKLYSDQDAIVQKAESIVRLMDAVASGEIKVSTDPKSAWQRFKRWLQDLLASIGFDTRSIDLSDPKNVREFAASFSDAIANGIKIKKVQGDGARSSAPDLQKDADRLVDGWYSRLNDAVVAKGSTMPASQWKTWMEARAKEGMMSMEEAKWTGLSDWLAGKGNEKVTPQQVREFLKENRVRVEVKELGGSKPPLEWRRYDLGAAGFYAEANGFKITPGGMGKVDLQGPNSYIGRYDGEEEAREAAEEVHQGSKEYGVTPKFSQYQLPGGTNYREVLVTLPGDTDGYQIIGPDGKVVWRDNSTKPDAELLEKLRATYPEGMGYRVRSGGDKSFKSTHYDEPNILVHLRLNDRTVDVPLTDKEKADMRERERMIAERDKLAPAIRAAAAKVRAIEDVGRKKRHEEGVAKLKSGEFNSVAEMRDWMDRFSAAEGTPELAEWQRLQQEWSDYNDRMPREVKPRKEKILFIEELQSDWGQQGKKKGFGSQEEKRALQEELKRREDEYNSMDFGSMKLSEIADRPETIALVELRDRINKMEADTPSAPFVTSTDAWVELGLKQAIRMAVQGGYDKVAWSTGEQQFNRWGSQAFAWSKGKTGWRIVGKEQSGGDAFAGMEEALAKEAKESDTIITNKEELREVVEDVMGRERSDYSPENWKTHINKVVDGMWERMQSEDSGTTMPRREGMKGFYDKILPTVAKKVSKRLGGDGVVGEVGLATSDIANKWSVRLANGSLYEGALTHRSAMDALNNGPKNHPHLDFDGAVIVKEPNTTDQQSISITTDMRAKVMSGVPMMQRRDPAEVAAVFAKHGMTADAARAYMQQKGIDPGFAQQVVDAMQQPAAGEANAGSLKSSIAPFYRLKIKDVADAKRVATTPAYKNFEATLIALADAMGIRIVRIVPGIGKWAGVIELSAKVEFATGQNFDRLREYTAIMGALAPESQDATIVGEYLRRGDPRVNGHAIRIPVNDLDKAISIAESSPVGGADIDTEAREVVIFANNEADVRQAQLVAEELRRQGVGTGEVISEPLRSEFISESRRADILNDVSSRLQGESGRQQGGSRLRDLVQLAQERDAAFQRLRGYNPSLASFADLRNRQIKLLESGEDLSDIDRRRLDVNRRRIAPAVRQQFSSWQGLYSEAKAEISEVGDRIAALFGGYNIPFSIKGVERATEKTLDWYLGNPTLLGDGARTTIIVDDISKADKVFDRIKKEYYSTREENYVTDLGYPKRLLEVLTANGRLAEFQVMTPGAYLAKDGVRMFPEDKKKDAASLLAEVRDLTGAQIPDGVGHLFYEIQRDPRVPKRLREAVGPVSQMYYKAFMDPSSMKGSGPSLMEALGGFMAEFQAAKADEGKWTAKHWTNNRELIREIISGTAGIDEKKPERAKRSITKKVVERFPETKDLVTDDMVYYERLPNGTTEAQAIELMNKYGTDSAMAAVMDRSSDMSHAVRMTLGGAVLSRLLEEKRYDDFTQFGESFATMGTELGQGIQALQIVYGRFWTPAIAVRAAQKAVAKDREKRKRAAKKTIERLKKGLEQENVDAAEEAVKAAKVRVKAAKAASSAEPKAEPASYGAKNKVFTRERYASALKSLRGKLLSGVPPELVDIIGYHIEAGTRSFADIAVKLTRSLGRKVLPYMKEAYTEAAKQANEQGIEFERTTDAEIDEYIFKANTDKAVEKLRKAIERKNKKEADAAIAELQQVSKDYGLWGQYREYAIDRLKRMQLQEIKQDIEADPPLREFTDSLVRNLSAQAREAAEEAGLEKPEPKKRRDDIEVIADAYKNFERYKEVWEATRREMQAPYFAAMARSEKAETPEARAEAQDAIQRERAKLERLDNYFGEVGPKPFAESIMAKAVKDGMKALDQKIEEIIKKHYTEYDSAKRSLQTKLVELAGLDGKEAEELASAVGAEFDRIATEKKRRFIRSVLPATDKVARKRKVKAVEDELVALTNAGAFSDDDFIKAYGEKMGWPKLTRENIQEIERLAERVQTSPEGRPRVEAIQDLLGYQQSIPGIDAMEIAQSVWYANMLSGFETQEVNVLANFANMLLEASIATGRMASSKEQRKYLAGLWTSMADGMSTGKLEASAVWRTGYDPIRGQIQVPSTLERHTFKGGAKNPANYLKYVRRFMVASDAIFFEGNRSLRAYQLAVRMASADKKLDPSIDVRNRAAELLGQGNAELEQAKMQAQREYDDEVSAINGSSLGAREKQKALKKADLDRRRRVFELTEKKRPEPIAVGAAQFARRATYNYKPEGALGAIANFINLGLQAMPALRYVVPFTNVIANVANETLNYTPVGYIRAVRGASKFRDEFTPDQKADAIWKASIGMATMAALYLLSHPTDDDDDPVIEITANGFGDYRKNEVLREKGWRPYSFRIGKGPYISYQYTPLILAMGFIGNLNDYAKYRKKKVTDGVLNKWSVSLGYTSLAFLDMTFLSSMNNVLSAAFDPRNEDRFDDLARGTAKTARSFIVPNLYTQGAKLVMNLAEVPQKETRGTIAGNLLRDIPIFRAQYQDAVNVLGEPVLPEWGRLTSMPQDDPVANFLGDKGISIVAPHPNTLTYTDGNGDERMYTDKQKHEFYVRRGQYIRARIAASMDNLGKMKKNKLENEIKEISKKGTEIAKMGLLGIQ